MADVSKVKVERIDDGLKPGDICYSFRTEKFGWLLCDGSSYNTVDYPELFEVIGYTFGGDGDFFHVPNCIGKFLQMKTVEQTVGQDLEAGLPNITGNLAGNNGNTTMTCWTSRTGAFVQGTLNGTATGWSSPSSSNTDSNFAIAIDASKSNPIYGKSETVQPPAIVCNYFIKY